MDSGDGGFGGRVPHHSPSCGYVHSPFLYRVGTRVYPRVRGVVGA